MTVPFVLSGGSPETATSPVAISTDATTAAGKAKARQTLSSGRAKRSFSAPQLAMPSSRGGSSKTTPFQLSMASTAPSSETKARRSRQTLSDKLTPSLISLGLVSGITPTSIRKLSGQPIRVLAFNTPAGGDAASPVAACSSGKGVEG